MRTVGFSVLTAIGPQAQVGVRLCERQHRLRAAHRVAGRVFVGSATGAVYSLDAKTGCTYWTFTAQAGVRTAMTVGSRKVASGEASTVYYFPVSDPREQQPGGLHAVRLDTGDRVWFAPPPPLKCGTGAGCTAAQSAAITVIPGAVFSGSFDGAIRARRLESSGEFDTNREFDTVNGVIDKGASIGGAAGPAVVGGMVYVSSGYSGPAGRAGNVLLAFEVD